jgi:hypothetical protein
MKTNLLCVAAKCVARIANFAGCVATSTDAMNAFSSVPHFGGGVASLDTVHHLWNVGQASGLSLALARRSSDYPTAVIRRSSEHTNKL